MNLKDKYQQYLNNMKKIKPCFCEICKDIEHRKKPNEVTRLVDGLGMCDVHAKVYERLKIELPELDEEDEWN